ncbi:hypothetical protein UFOVP1082_46 [uncultured Caudovirales phage]|uniref:Tail completion protein n=1 Tax=uncultured Caudovirales phage TaxID=2100421 RepID=A0A6J5Q1V0_9CAUD|nr:hypothetical protein UFOVP906_24 [uncultured Caudovirales phage]CAB4176657.1 hypothetical protein UFOVP992_50 [uncultured Caudovirales phage]CAB4183440.1 hypothetical protein UFOVP1082_46 [uncultured Caudovirales phage]CAB4197601.1 hypothetical protein UFOVP1322_31 [uncultured Caudovirales phage]CAB4212948.1 hypothetical protein UFOVP1434_53 [uncultured Caudovirales phage]
MYKAVNVSDVSKALVAMLSDDQNLADINATICRSEVLNETPAMCPWLGIYRVMVNFQPRTLGVGGVGGSMRQLIDMAIVAQQSDGTSGEQCEDRLEELMAALCSALLSDTTVRGTVQIMSEMSISYDDYKVSGEQFMQTAILRATYETRVS